MKIRFILLSLVALILGTTFAQSDDLKHAAVDTYAHIVFASYEDSLTTAQSLQQAIADFIAAPSAQSLQVARLAWLAAQEPYGQTEAYRFYGGPIDDEDGPEGLLNAWPLDEAYVDYVDGDADAGIINNVADYPEINKELLVSLNEVGAEENISTGYHAIEFLLWGQDLSTESAGQRPYTDYTTAANAERRGQYLQAAAARLVDDLQYLVDAWAPNSANYRADFLAKDADAALTDVITGMGVLAASELAGERMFTAYDNRDQEDEHSCFSDNTHRDIITNLQGIINVYNGTYVRLDGSVVSGVGIGEVIAAADEAAAAQLSDTFTTAKQLSLNIHYPFDRAISESTSRPVVLETVMELISAGDLLAEASSSLGYSISTALP